MNKTTRLGSMNQLFSKVSADGKLDFKEADAIAKEAVRGTLTQKTIEAAKDFFDKTKLKTDIDAKQVESQSGGQALTQVLYWGMPRDLSGFKGSGQTFSEGLTMNAHQYFFGDRPKEPLQLHVNGAAKKAYTLKFKIAETAFKVAIPKGATAAQTAKLVAKAIDAYHYDEKGNPKAEAMENAAGGKKALHWNDSDAYAIGVSAKSRGGTVFISPTIDS